MQNGRDAQGELEDGWSHNERYDVLSKPMKQQSRISVIIEDFSFLW